MKTVAVGFSALAIVATVVAVVVFWGATTSESLPSQDEVRKDAAEQLRLVNSEGNQSLRHIKTSPSKLDPYIEFASASTSGAALQAISRFQVQRPADAADARLYVAGICKPYVQGMHLTGMQPWLDARLSEFCGDYYDSDISRSTGGTAESVMNSGGTRSLLEALLSEAGDESGTAGVLKAIDDIALASDSPIEVHAALQISGERNLLPPSIKRYMSASELIRAQEIMGLVAEFQYCSMTGSCGANSQAALRGCLATDVCGAHHSYIEQLRRINSEQNFEAALRLQKILNSARHDTF